MNMDFGKNRIQYDDYLWSHYKYKRYNVHFYGQGKPLGDYVSVSAQINLLDIQDFFDHTLQKKIEFIVYNTQEQSRASNIGNIADELHAEGSEIRTIDNKVFLYFNGDHKDLDIQIRKGIAKVLLEELIYGTGYTDLVKNSSMLFMPDWYFDGLVRFTATQWTKEDDEALRGIIGTRKKLNLNHLNRHDAGIAGQSSWYYIADRYGARVIPRIVKVARNIKNIQGGYLYNLGIEMDEFLVDWKSFINENIKADLDQLRCPDAALTISKKNKKGTIYQRPIHHKNGQLSAYVTNRYSQQKVFLVDEKTGKRKTILRLGHRIDIPPDETFPVVTWHPFAPVMSVFYESKGELIWMVYNHETEEIISSPFAFFQKIRTAEYSHDGKKIIITATANGQSDVYLLDVQSRASTQITADYFDETDASFIDNQDDWIVFTSNRNIDSLKYGGKTNKVYDGKKYIYLLNLKTFNPRKRDKSVVINLTSQFNGDALQITQGSNNTFYYTANYSGVSNLYKGKMDSTIAYIDTTIHYRYFAKHQPITNQVFNISDPDFNGKNISYVSNFGNKEFIFQQDTSVQFKKNPGTTVFRRQLNLFIDRFDQDSTDVQKEIYSLKDIKKRMEENPNYADPNYFVFKDEREIQITDSSILIGDQNNEKAFQPFEIVPLPVSDTSAILAKQRNYELAFKAYEVSFDIDNEFLNPSYQNYSGNGDNLNPGLSGFIKYGIIDLFEDYKVVGGFRINDFSSNEVFITYINYKKRWDKQWLFYRSSNNSIPTPGTKSISYELLYRLTFPFSMVDRIQMTFSTRMDEFIPLSLDENTLTTNHTFEYRPNVRVNYTYDNTRSLGQNLLTGTRLKVFSEYYQMVPEFKNMMWTYGGDIRHYLPLHKRLVWANRLAFGSSYGTQRLMYYLGGVDSWLFNQFNNELGPSELNGNSIYRYQTLATNMRGFLQNIRNGPAFAAINSEVRWPIFRYLYPRPIKNGFIKNFQVIGFSDIGTAWSGFSPFAGDNPINVQNFNISNGENPIGVVEVRSNKQPIVYGYGFGVRSELWGYFIRADWAWGVGDGNAEERVFYLSLNYDF
jgi:hypothetical protein